MEQYRKEHTDPSAFYAAVITLKDKAISEYEEARRMGIGTFCADSRRTKCVPNFNRKAKTLLLAEIEMLLERNIVPSYRYTATINGFCIDITEAESKKIFRGIRRAGLQWHLS